MEACFAPALSHPVYGAGEGGVMSYKDFCCGGPELDMGKPNNVVMRAPVGMYTLSTIQKAYHVQAFLVFIAFTDTNIFHFLLSAMLSVYLVTFS